MPAKNTGFNRIILKNYKYICVCILIPVLAMTIAFQWMSVRQRRMERMNDNAHAVSACVQQLDQLWLTISRIGFRLGSDSNALAVLRNDRERLSSGFLARLNSLQTLLTTLTYSYDEVDQITLYYDDPAYFVKAGCAIASISDHTIGLNNTYTWFNEVSRLYKADSINRWVASSDTLSSYTRQVASNGATWASLIVIDMPYVRSTLDSYLLNRHGLQVYDATDESVIQAGRPFTGDSPETTDGIAATGDGSRQVIRMTSAVSGWTAVLTSDESEYDNYVRQSVAQTALLTVSAAALCAVLSYFITLMICRPYRAIAQLLDAPCQDAVKRYETEYAEIDNLGIIRDLIRQSKYQLFAAQNELESRDHLLRDAQSVALQAQINPHFLYNTLESINWKVISAFGGESNDISEMICDLSQLLRLSIGSREPLIPLREEVEHARMYIKIQMRRFPNRFRVDWEIQESLMPNTVVQLTLHPLLENAILHGVKRMTEFGVIRVSGEVRDGVLFIHVRDNGPGFTPEVLEQIKARKAEGVFRTSEHVGLFNVDQRLQLIFGEAYGLTISSTPFVETCVTMRLPVREGQQAQ